MPGNKVSPRGVLTMDPTLHAKVRNKDQDGDVSEAEGSGMQDYHPGPAKRVLDTQELERKKRKARPAYIPGRPIHQEKF